MWPGGWPRGRSSGAPGALRLVDVSLGRDVVDALAIAAVPVPIVCALIAGVLARGAKASWRDVDGLSVTLMENHRPIVVRALQGRVHVSLLLWPARGGPGWGW